ncbi:carbonic anhydrase 2-like [Haliotis asinina]|uniref:carbonic anhydrase 2-like n=1 Tax=Haliotis asinina TaxID=109174 RepID=UPI00353272A5
MLIPIAVVVVATNVYVAAERALCPVSLHKVHFNYHFGSMHDPFHWYELDKNTHCCNGSKQSPINIETQDTKCAKLGAIQYEFKRRRQLRGRIRINGHGATLAFFKQDRLVTKDFPFTNGEYVLASMHFHSPSEHLVNGRHHAGVLHLSHYKKEYGSIPGAIDKADGVVVIGVFLRVRGKSENNAFNRYVDGVSAQKGDKHEIVSLDPRELLRDGDYYTYKGSLTTPPFSESVR